MSCILTMKKHIFFNPTFYRRLEWFVAANNSNEITFIFKMISEDEIVIIARCGLTNQSTDKEKRNCNIHPQS